MLVFSILLLFPLAARADCDNPCGLEEVLTCAAQERGMQPEEYFNTVLYDTDIQDGFCKQAPQAGLTTSSRDFFKLNYCKNATSYYSYANFIKAAKSFPTFLCVPGSGKKARLRELANFLATVGQETTSGKPYTNTGLYWRYENSALTSDIDIATTYANQMGDQWWAFTTTGDMNGDTMTDIYWNGAAQGQANVYRTTDEQRMLCSWGNIPTPPDGYVATRVVDLMNKGYWVGMGPKQLTADSMMGFFGWYNQHLAANAPVNTANFKAFVERYLNDGVLSFQGAIWYWMKRVNRNDNPPTISEMVSDPDSAKRVCQDIGFVTWMVNGGCNDSDGREKYYQYFIGGEVFNIYEENYCVTTSSGKVCSYDCGKALYDYCMSVR